ncbi:MAG: glycosyltransferase family protein [Acidimicrobiia bacterium]
MKLRVCLIDHKTNLSGYTRSLPEALTRRFDVTPVFVDDGWPRGASAIPDYQSYDAFIWHVKFRYLMDQAPFDWGDYEGARIMFDTDAFLNFFGRRYRGRYPATIRDNQFHALVCTGRAVRDRFLATGINAHWIPKGYDGEQFSDLGRPDREGIVYFGRRWLSRQAMLAHLRRRHVPVHELYCPFNELNDRLNGFLGCLICNMNVRGERRIPTRVLRVVPKHWLRPGPGPEPMIKNFEAAASGCAPICDDFAELADLGFRDGVTMVSYNSFPELTDKVRHYLDAPEALREIGRRAAEVARTRHTWDHRAEELEKLIRSGAYLPS